jgi:C-terminal processing protease CtpA/Prc
LLEPSQPADRFGALWMSDGAAPGGVVLTWVYPDTPAEKALLRPGDRIVRFAGYPIRHGQDLTNLLPTAQNPVSIEIHRSGSTDPLTLSLELAGNPVRLGITWRVDDAEPESVLLTHVLPGSPAAQAGLQTGDRVLRIGTNRFDSEEKFAQLARTLLGPSEFVIERNGQVLHKVIQLPIAVKRAA